MGTSEELREALASSQRENERLRNENLQANLLLQTLGSLLRLQIDEDPFKSVFDSLHRIFSFEQAMVLAESDSGGLSCIAASHSSLVGCRFPIGTFFKKVMAGRVTTTFDNRGLEEWRDIRDDALSVEQPALYLPLSVRDRRGILILLRDVGTEAFDRSHVTLARKFFVLASHALAAMHTSQIIRAAEARALAAEEASKIKNLFIANMSHELRTPLNAIIGFSDIIHREQFGPVGTHRYLDYAGDILTSGRHLLGLINNLLLQSTIEAGRYNVHVEKLDLDREVTEAMRVLAIDADRGSIHLSYARQDLPIIAFADRRAFRQILLNIIGNAIKFSNADGSVEVKIANSPDKRKCELSVIDHGCGIPAETLAQLGQPFVLADDSFSRRHQGTGLGISICYGLAQAMDVTLTIESTISVGTTVKIILPLEADFSE